MQTKRIILYDTVITYFLNVVALLCHQLPCTSFLLKSRTIRRVVLYFGVKGTEICFYEFHAKTQFSTPSLVKSKVLTVCASIVQGHVS